MRPLLRLESAAERTQRVRHANFVACFIQSRCRGTFNPKRSVSKVLAITGAIKGAGLGRDVLLLTDGRFSGGRRVSAWVMWRRRQSMADRSPS